ncbi:MAG: hypothetical protein NVS9B14_04670 [Candidatus Acidiferrum sp.]
MRLLLVIFFAVAFPSAEVLTQSACDESTLKQAAADVRDARAKLLTVKVADWGIRVMAGSLDVDIMTRPAIFRYKVVGKSLRRTQPIAMNGRDFVDEWLASDWNDAKRWASSGHREPLHVIPEEMESTWKSTSLTRPLYHFGPVLVCSQASKQFQVELDRDPGSPSYFRIEQGQNSFTMISVNKHADPACKGPDLMQKK